MSLVIVRAVGMVTVQDLGRPGRMHEGLAAGGALVPQLLVAANRFARNPDGAAAFEVIGQLVLRAEREITVATEEHARVLREGEDLLVTNGTYRATYLAVHGGLDVPIVLGGRGAQLSAGLGGLVQAGERFLVGARGTVGTFAESTQLPDGPIRIVPGPDLDAFAPDALARLCGAPYTISPTSDRVGNRLDGPTLPRRADWQERTCPMVRGAIEVPGDGQPIVLGPEHPTTGGYPVLAVIAHTDLGKIFAARLGQAVTFQQ